jgi:hypothetical protein
MILAVVLREKSGILSLHSHFQHAVVVQTVVVFGTVFSLFLKASSFGSDVSCNQRRVVVLFFFTLQALGNGRTVGMTISALLTGAFMWCVYRRRYMANATSTPGRLVATCLLIILFAITSISHAELFLARNHPQAGELSWSSLGQVGLTQFLTRAYTF